MSINDTAKSIHRLAVLRDDASGQDPTSIVLRPMGLCHPHPGELVDTTTPWTAQTYRGKGQWGSISGRGSSPEEALSALHDGLLDAHRAIDERREKALRAAQGVPQMSRERSDDSACQCPPKPFFAPGSLASGSATEDRAHDRWEAEHGSHPNAEAARTNVR